MPYGPGKALPDYVQKLPDQKQRQWRAVWNSSFDACMKDSSDTAKCESAAFARANGVVKGSEDEHNVALHELGLRLAKADERVEYSEAASIEGNNGHVCGSCCFYDAPCTGCALVEGTIEPSWTCKLWTEALMSPIPLDEPHEDPYQMFVEAVASFKDADFSKPSWIPFLPKPGIYTHAKYGQISITREQNEEMMRSVKEKVYQEHIPIDAEHETKLSGAVAWLRDMRTNGDGSADALVEWTGRGKALMSQGAFRYVSPEWFSAWRDPATSLVHRNVVAGGAITTRPFFKDKVLRALVASETEITVVGADDGKELFTDMSETCPSCGKTYTEDAKTCPHCGAKLMGEPQIQTFTEDQVRKLVDEKVAEASSVFTEKIDGLTTKLAESDAARAAAEATAAAEQEANKKLTERVTAMENDARHKRFADLVAGKGGAGDGAPWVGDQQKHVTILEKLADSFGEEDETFKNHVEQQTAVAAQFKESSLFEEIGTGRPAPAASDPEKRIDQLVTARMKENPELTEAKAYDQVLASEEGSRLYGQIPTRRQDD